MTEQFPMHCLRAILLTTVAILLPALVIADDEQRLGKFTCTVLSDQQKGTVLTFDAESDLLFWGSLEPKEMIVQSEKADPFEVVVVSEEQRQPRVGLRIFGERGALRFVAGAGDSLFVGSCIRV